MNPLNILFLCVFLLRLSMYKRFYGTDLCRSESNKDHSLFYIFCLYTERSVVPFFVLRWGLLGATLAIVTAI